MRDGYLPRIRKYCLGCCNKGCKEVKLCLRVSCPVHAFRFGKKTEDSRITPLKAIKQCCLNCSGGSKKSVSKCECEDCPLYKYRKGKNPNLTGKRKHNIAQFNHVKKQVNTQALKENERLLKVQ